MTYADRWLLPDGVEDILPAKALRIESLRRRLVDLYGRWGYELVIPPLMEYTDSLLIGLGRDIDLMTFKVTDQLSGRSMGIRADITPQTARMDAHSLKRSGPSRLCYAGHVLHTRPKSPLATRSPIQAGVELYGEAGVSADTEVISLLLASLQESGLEQLNIDLGHVGIYRSLADAAGLDEAGEQDLFDLLQAKASTDIRHWVKANVASAELSEMLLALPQLAGDREVLQRARKVLARAPADVLTALDTLETVAETIARRYPAAQLYFDLSELRGYHYHTGIVFAAFAPGYGAAVANGGRYDHVGEVFGNARPATGFAVDITALDGLLQPVQGRRGAIFAPAVDRADNDDYWNKITELRDSGEVVVCGFAGQEASAATPACDRQLVFEGGDYRLQPL
ncbi:MAG: ATP phosphoribosyltransferase regulatory subunit [Gammaproteobacteria bacterium]|uniref:ATP phosphoribosyltransferase regulatory subunit n=1 Tax=Pseudomaricurvus alcaniphilus TaxID=1166482 RepID=UPI001407251E|nr:ATP phosphoribosyltransferase regulatory subunit [Pseudomaricurvus alcaniphilus]MBR9909803.1 ATP phosphoribosyltransferase regulatory subunit [Gammaproteobacteria bacterium]NHN38529.1 ATP phosphoribosyltransferase regulatory subunit [Pseudomaricurvus alcaniphilus]